MQGLTPVVDDGPKIVNQARVDLRNAGSRAIAAGDGPTALAAVRYDRPDLEVLELNLPGLDGSEIFLAMRRVLDVPMILLTPLVQGAESLIRLEVGARICGSVPGRYPELIRAGKLNIDVHSHRMACAGNGVALMTWPSLLWRNPSASPANLSLEDSNA